jgi:hypothetical protein
MRALAVLLVAGLAGSLVGSWWLLAADAAPPLPSAPAAEAAAADPAEAAPTAERAVAAAGPFADDDAAEDAEPADAADASGDRVAVATDQRRAPRVQVLRGNPPEPVAGAVVHFVLEDDARRRLGANPRGLSRWEWPQALGQRATTGADGIAALPRADAPWLCAASSGDGFGVAIVPPRDRTFPIALQVDEQLTLIARTADDAPAAGAPLAVVQQFDAAQGRVVWQGLADESGRARIAHFQLLRENRNPAPAAERFAALPLVPAATAVELAARPAPREPVLLQLPPLGGVRVQLVDHGGTPLLCTATVGLSAWSPVALAAGSALVLPRGVNAQRVEKRLGDDPVLLPFVEIGQPVHAYARFPLDRRPAELVLPAGPGRNGEVLAVPFPLRDTQAVVAGRLLVGPDVALANGRADAALWTTQRDVLAFAVETVADGRFDVVLPQRNDAQEYWLELRCEPPMGKDGAVTARLGARVRVPAIRGGARIDLGTVRLDELLPCVHGVVVDDEGQPVAEADVHVQQQEPARDPNAPPNWRTLPLYRTRSDAEGAFLIPGVLPPGTLRVRADTGKHFADQVALHTQGQQVRIALVRNGILRGQVLLPEFVADGVASLQLQPFDESLRKAETRSVDLSRRRGGRFVVEPLRPGRFDAIVRLRNVPEPVAVVPDVFVTPGEVRDGRLRPLDLRAALFRYRLRAVDAVGAPLAPEGPILARFQKPDGTLAETGFRWQKGRAELIAPSSTVDAVFFGRGHQTVRLLLGPGDTDVRLPATRPALVELPGARALCGPTRRVRVSVLLQGDTGLPGSLGGVDQRTGERFGFQRWDLGRSSGAWLGVSDTVEIPLMQSGKYEVLLRPHAGDTERSPQAHVSLGTFELHVDHASWQPLRVPVDPVKLGQALQQLDQQWAQQQAQAQARQQQPGRRGPGAR